MSNFFLALSTTTTYVKMSPHVVGCCILLMENASEPNNNVYILSQIYFTEL